MDRPVYCSLFVSFVRSFVVVCCFCLALLSTFSFGLFQSSFYFHWLFFCVALLTLFYIYFSFWHCVALFVVCVPFCSRFDFLLMTITKRFEDRTVAGLLTFSCFGFNFFAMQTKGKGWISYILCAYVCEINLCIEFFFWKYPHKIYAFQIMLVIEIYSSYIYSLEAWIC